MVFNKPVINDFSLFMGVWLFSIQWALHKKTGSTSISLHTTQAKLYILDNVKNNNVSE